MQKFPLQLFCKPKIRWLQFRQREAWLTFSFSSVSFWSWNRFQDKTRNLMMPIWTLGHCGGQIQMIVKIHAAFLKSRLVFGLGVDPGRCGKAKLLLRLKNL